LLRYINLVSPWKFRW